MAAGQELDSLLVRLIGEKAEYEKFIAEAEQELLEVARNLKNAADQVEAEQRRALEEGARLFTAVATPIERYQSEMKNLDSLLAQNIITEETYNRALEKHWKNLPKVQAAQDALNEEL